MIKFFYKNKNYISQQILKSLKIYYYNKKKKIKYKYNYFNIKLKQLYSQIIIFLKVLFIFYWIIKQFFLFIK
ncbi:orf d (apicoplast) [Cystoisospora suis]|uniref:Orf d n=1 Tax=Cystoisospora suis TaxID=483139 RepID=A0A2C6LEX1_9APIC|nr:orf d [Cystoisospora suis]